MAPITADLEHCTKNQPVIFLHGGPGYNALSGHVSLELGREGSGYIGSLKMHGPQSNNFLFLYADEDGTRLDHTKGEYFFNSDPQVTNGFSGKLMIGDGNGDPRVRLDADGRSFIANGHLGLGTEAPQARLHVVGGAIMPQPGNTPDSGIMFPSDPGGPYFCIIST